MTSELRPAVETRAKVLDQLLSELQDGNAWDSTISLLADYADLVQDLLKDRETVRAYWYRQGKDDGWQMCKENEIDRLREELAEAYIKLSGKSIHTSDCATSNAPAMEPGPCNCDAPGDADLIDKLRDTDSYYRIQEKHWCIDGEELERQRLAAAALIETQAAELAKWREKYDGLGNDALKKIGEMGARIGRLDVELDAAKADLQAANRELANYKALAETLAGALEAAAYALHTISESSPDCMGWEPPYPSTVSSVSVEAKAAAETLRKYKEARDV